MKVKDGKYYVTNVMQMLGWALKDGDVGMFDPDEGLVKVTLYNKSTYEEREVYMRAELVPVSSTERTSKR